MKRSTNLKQSIESVNAVEPKKQQTFQEVKPVKFFQLFRFASSTQIIMMIIGIICSVIIGIMMPVYANFLGNIMDAFALKNERFQEAKKTLLYFIYIGIGTLVAGSIMYSTWSISGERMAIKCRKEYYKSLMKQEMAWFDTHNPNQLISSFHTDSLSFQLAVGEKISSLILVLSMILASIGFAVYHGWILSLIILGYLPFLMISWAKNVKIRHAAFKQYDQIFGESDLRTQQSLKAIKMVKQMNGQEFQLASQKGIFERVKQKYIQTGLRFACGGFFAYLSLYIAFTLSYWYGAQCVFGADKCPQSISSRPYTAGLTLKIVYGLIIPILSLNQLTPSLQKIAEGLAAASRIFSIIDRESKIVSKQNAIIPDKFNGVIKFQNVSFSYPKDKNVKILNAFNLTIDCKQSAIIGKSGFGKSTILQLIMRFYDPDEGSVSLDGIDLRDLDLDWLRNQIGYVGQEPVLFATSIKENLMLAKPDATEEDIKQCLDKAQALVFTNELADKLETFVGAGGNQLSGGQKQRIAIARALLKKPKLLLLDEATSALDPVNEGLILRTLNKQSLLSISVTHHSTVLQSCDKFFELVSGNKAKVHICNGSKEDLTEFRELLDKDDEANRQFLKKQKSMKMNQNDAEMLKKQNFKLKDSNEMKIQINQSGETEQKIAKNEMQNLQYKKIQKQQSWSVLKLLFEHKFLIFLGLLIAVIDGTVFPWMGLFVAHMLANMALYPLDHEYYREIIYKFTYLMLGLSIIGSVTHSLAIMMGSILGGKTINEIRSKITEKILKLPLEWYQRDENHSEKIVEKLTVSCRALHRCLAIEMPFLTIILINIVGCIAGSIIIEWRTGLTSIGLIPLIVLSQAIQFGFIQGFASQKGKIYESSSKILGESVSNIKTVLPLGNLASFTARYQTLLDSTLDFITKKSVVSGFMYGVSQLLQYITFGLVFFFAVLFVNSYDIKIQNALSAVLIILFGCMSAGNKSNLLQDLEGIKEASAWASKIIDMKDQHQIRVQAGSRLFTTPINGNIEFQNVSFNYKNREENVLQNLTLRIREGEQIVLVGHSGCGKSTIMSLLLGFYEPTQGEILLDGINIKDYDLRHLRNSFGVVSQEPVLFNETIEWNIRYNQSEVTREDIMLATADANLVSASEFKIEKEDNELLKSSTAFLAKTSSKEFLNDTAQKIEENQSDDNDKIKMFQKNVGPRGSHVSGGQKQRIAIARTILRKPNILLLDEITSALDAQNQAKVEESLQRIMRGRTTLSITHRLQAIKQNKIIFVINNGKVEESGDVQSLIKKRGRFFNMLQGKQSIKVE